MYVIIIMYICMYIYHYVYLYIGIILYICIYHWYWYYGIPCYHNIDPSHLISFAHVNPMDPRDEAGSFDAVGSNSLVCWTCRVRQDCAQQVVIFDLLLTMVLDWLWGMKFYETLVNYAIYVYTMVNYVYLCL